MFSKAISDGQGGASIGTTSNGPQDSRDFRAERALGGRVLQHRFVGSYVYDLPFGRGAHGVVHAIIGGWTTAGIVSLSSGLRVNLTVLGNPSNTGATDRPIVLHDWNLSGSDARSIAGLTLRPSRGMPLRIWKRGRNLIGGPALTNFDLALYKQFRINERIRTQFRAEAFNATNTPAFGVPNAQVGNPSMGQISSADRPRNLQLG
jgi:hypothetical protein